MTPHMRFLSLGALLFTLSLALGCSQNAPVHP
jgi:hypothetical protein